MKNFARKPTCGVPDCDGSGHVNGVLTTHRKYETCPIAVRNKFAPSRTSSFIKNDIHSDQSMKSEDSNSDSSMDISNQEERKQKSPIKNLIVSVN